jgi:hypothetical protein
VHFEHEENLTQTSYLFYTFSLLDKEGETNRTLKNMNHMSSAKEFLLKVQRTDMREGVNEL